MFYRAILGGVHICARPPKKFHMVGVKQFGEIGGQCDGSHVLFDVAHRGRFGDGACVCAAPEGGCIGVSNSV